MVIGIATGLVGLGLALPTGMAFGYGYGYGVRAGYNAYKQPSSEVQKLKLSADPVQGALGAGLQSAEERTGVQLSSGVPKQLGMTDEPSLANQAAIAQAPQERMISSPLPGIAPVPRSSLKSHEDYVAFVKGLEPWKSKSRKYMARHRTFRKMHKNYR